MEHTKQAVTVITKKNLTFWEKRRQAFFAKDPHCKICGDPILHYSRTMECGNCQNKKYRKPRKERQGSLAERIKKAGGLTRYKRPGVKK